jgi:hypothetical protein
MGQAEHNITGVGVHDGNVNGRKWVIEVSAGGDAIKTKAPSSVGKKMGLFAKRDQTANLEYDDQS